MKFDEVLQTRYSVRQLADKKVSDEQIRSIVEAARLAPTAANRQPFKVWVLKTEEARKKAANAFSFDFVKNAPVIFVVGANMAEAWVRNADNYNFGAVDAAIAATSMMYEITNQGLGTTWIGHFEPVQLQKAFPQMQPYLLIAIFGVGYPAADAKPHPFHFRSKPLDELSEIL